MKSGHLTLAPNLNRAPRSIRTMLIETGRRALCQRRLRQTVVAVLITALVLTALPLVRRVNPPAQAQGPTVLLRACNPDHPLAPGQIIQKCKLDSGTGGAAEAELENGVINDLLKVHKLPWSDKQRLLGWERNLIRAGVLERIINFIKKSPAERTAWEQTVFSELTKLVKARRVLAATKALEEYNRWLNIDNCPYVPPPPFTRSPESCVVNPSLLFGGRTPPSFEEFQVYGGYLANKELNDPTNQMIMKNTALGVGLLGGVVFAGVAAGVGAAIGATTAFGLTAGKAIFLTFAGAVSLAAKGSTPILVGGVAGATAIAAPVAIVIFAVVVGVIRGIQVFEQEQIPIKLQEAKTNKENETPDLTQLITTEEGLGEIYAELIQATLPDFPATTGVPAASAADPQFEFRPDIVTTFSPTPALEYQDWEGKLHTVRMNGGWFVDRKGSEEERLTLSIQFINHQGRNRQASRSGGQFVISDLSEDKSAPQLTSELHYLDGNFVRYVARIPNIIPVITAFPVVRHQEPPAPTIDPHFGQPTDFNVSHIATISDNDPIAQLDVAIYGPLTSNGVTLSEFRVDPDGKVFARIQPSCSATDAEFTLQVTDTSGMTAFGSIIVTVAPNQPPALEYGSTYIVSEHGSLVAVPTVWPTDDNTSWGTPGFKPPVWTLDEPVITPQGTGGAFTGTVKLLTGSFGSPTGTIELDNAGPTGPYTVSVTVKDTCGKATTRAFFLSVRCVGPAFTSSATNPTSSGARNGQITLTASGGTGGLLYSIDNGQTLQSSNVFAGLAAGDYLVTVKDSASCFAASQKVTLTEPAAITVSTTEVKPTCYAVSDGQITVTASGGAGALQYSINNGQSFQSGNVFTGLSAGSYPIKVKDANGNSPLLAPTVVLVSPLAVSFTTTPVNPTCNGASNGRITVNASGGDGLFMYSRDNGASFQSSNVFSNLVAGSYQIKVKDSKGCSVATQTVTLTNPAPVIAQVSGGGLLCPSSLATITVNVTGGTAPYIVKLSDGQTKTSMTSLVTFNVSPSVPTTYTATATDSNGCPATVSGSATVTPDNIAPLINVPAPISVDGNSSGGATVTFSVTATDNCGAEVTLLLSNTSRSFFPFGATGVTATATDQNGNRSQASFTVTVRTLQQQASLINAQVQALITAGELNAGQGAGLSNKLAEIIAKLSQGETNAACNQLNAFINQVNAIQALETAQRQSLITAVNALRKNIGC